MPRMMSNRSDATVPGSAAWLGGCGALPFIALSCAAPFVSGPTKTIVMHALAGYGAVILSFLGGVHWGLAIAETRAPSREPVWIRLAVSVLPSLAAWIALLTPARAGSFVLAASVAAMLWVDMRATRLGDAPPWYPRLRLPLTGVVVVALLFGALA